MFLRAALIIVLCLVPAAAGAQSLGEIAGFSALAGANGQYASNRDPGAGSGPLSVTYRSGKRVIVPTQNMQTDFNDIQLAPDHKTLGWLAEYLACAQSYPCALQLVVFRDGKILRQFTPGYGIMWFWEFLGGGRQIAIQYGFPHGDANGAFELYDISSGRLLQKYQGTGPVPGWVQTFKDPLNQ